MKTQEQRRRDRITREVIGKYMLLDPADRARVDERIDNFLEADKYKRPHFELVKGGRS